MESVKKFKSEIDELEKKIKENISLIKSMRISEKELVILIGPGFKVISQKDGELGIQSNSINKHYNDLSSHSCLKLRLEKGTLFVNKDMSTKEHSTEYIKLFLQKIKDLYSNDFICIHKKYVLPLSKIPDKKASDEDKVSLKQMKQFVDKHKKSIEDIWKSVYKK